MAKKYMKICILQEDTLISFKILLSNKHNPFSRVKVLTKSAIKVCVSV